MILKLNTTIRMRVLLMVDGLEHDVEVCQYQHVLIS